jgi:hypothetical protein
MNMKLRVAAACVVLAAAAVTGLVTSAEPAGSATGETITLNLATIDGTTLHVALHAHALQPGKTQRSASQSAPSRT